VVFAGELRAAPAALQNRDKPGVEAEGPSDAAQHEDAREEEPGLVRGEHAGEGEEDAHRAAHCRGDPGEAAAEEGETDQHLKDNDESLEDRVIDVGADAIHEHMAPPGGKARSRLDDVSTPVPEGLEDFADCLGGSRRGSGGRGGSRISGSRGGGGNSGRGSGSRISGGRGGSSSCGSGGRISGYLYTSLHNTLREHPSGLGAAREIEPALADLVETFEEPGNAEPHPEKDSPEIVDSPAGKTADEGAVLIPVDIEELVLAVLPELVETGNIEEVPHIDHVLEEEGPEALGLDAHGIGNAVMGSERNHDPVIVGLEGRPLGAAIDIGDNVLRGRFGSEVCGLNDLREGSLAEDIAGVVADNVGEGILRGLHLGIGLDAVALADRQTEGGAELGARHTAGPDKGAGLDGAAILEVDLAGLGADNRCAKSDNAVALLEIGLGRIAELLLEVGDDIGQSLDIHDGDVVRIEVILLAHGVALVQKLADHLDAGEAGARDDEGEKLFALVGVGLGRGFAVDIVDVLADLHRVFERPEREGILLDAGDTEELRLSADAYDDLIEGVLGLFGVGNLGFKIDLLDSIEDNIDALAPEDLLEADLD